jgi:hypothetical protein
MRTENSERDKQQDGHEPECVEKERIFIPIVMGGVCQVTRELPV